MRSVIIGVAAVICIALMSWGIYLGVSQNGTTRTLQLDPSYTQRVAQGYWAKGTLGAPVILTEYSDFQCQACYEEYSIIEGALRQSSIPFEFRFRQYPLPQDDKSILAAEAAEAAGRQGKFWNMYEILYANQPTWGSETPDQFRNSIGMFISSLGLNSSQFYIDLNDSTISDPINADITASNNAHADATPAIFINGTALNPLPNTVAELLTAISKTSSAPH